MFNPSHIKKIRETRNINQIQAADEIGIALSTLRSIEQGGKPKRLDVIQKVQSWYDKNVKELRK